MAWADLLTRTTSNDVTAADWNLIKSALQERTGWIGDAAQHTNADNLTISQDDDIDASEDQEVMQDIVEAIAGSFARTGTSNASGCFFGSWSFEDLCAHVYDNHGGEASGMYHNGYATYGWIRKPSRDGGAPDLGHPQTGDKIYYEHVRGLAYAIDHLRYLHTEMPTVNRWATKQVGCAYATSAAAWSAMKSATPSISDFGSDEIVGCSINEDGGLYGAYDSRILYQVQMENAWLAGHAPTAWADAKFLIEADAGGTFLGPFTLKTNVTNSAAGAYSTGSAFEASFTIAAAGTPEEFTIDNPDNHPKSTSTVYVLHYNPTYDGGDPGEFSELCTFSVDQFDMVLKPTTTYGT